ncbi:MAG: hypothetical protein K5851_03855 [Lachnospiraceae bacterium]|nr:hypothetical protein [Lachnospiraceae bacterium]
MAKKKRRNISKFPDKPNINISLIIVLIIMIYILYYIFSYLTRSHISVYEVKMGSIARNNHYDAMAIRDETVVNAEKSGYPFYYAANSSRVGAQSKIYGIDDSGKLTKKLNSASNQKKALDETELGEFENTISIFMDGYKNIDFSKNYIFKTDLEDQIQKAYNNEAANAYEGDINSAIQNGSYQVYTPVNTGFLVYSIDGYEGTTLDNFTSMKDKKDVKSVPDLRTNKKIKAGQPVYKIINSDDWSLTMNISKKVYLELKDKMAINIKFDYDGSKTTAASETKKIGNKYYLILNLTNSMERFASNRFISIELLINQESGLKIPNSAIDEKEFYVIPKDYFMLGNNAKDLGLMTRGNGDSFVSPEIYYSTVDNYYVLKSDLKDVKEIVIPNSSDTYTLSHNTKKCKGVYNVNKGFADFRIINVLYSTDDYSIISDESSYGVTLYDHIALDGKNIENGKIIY